MYLGTHAVSIWAEARGLSLSTSWQSLSLDLELTKRLGCPSSNMLVSACPQPEDPSIPVSHIHAMAPDFCVDAGWGSELRSSYLPAVYQLIYLPSPYVNFLGGCFTKKINRQQNLIVPQKKKMFTHEETLKLGDRNMRPRNRQHSGISISISLNQWTHEGYLDSKLLNFRDYVSEKSWYQPNNTQKHNIL